MDNKNEIVVYGYLRVLPSEIKFENTAKIASAIFLIIQHDNLVFKTRRISTVGQITRIFSGKKFTDYALSLEDSSVTVRAWSNTVNEDLIGEIREQTPVVAYGVLREYNDYLYVSATLIRKVPSDYFEMFKRQLKADRKLLTRLPAPAKA